MHPEAIKNFNKQAEGLMALVKCQQIQKTRKTDSQKGYFISHTITKKDIIGEISMSLTNAFRDDLGYLFQVEQKDYGITGSDYEELKKCAERIQKDKTFNMTSSVNFVTENLKKWTRNRYEKKEEKDFISFLQFNLDSSIKKYQVWVPIPFTSIENDFSIGNVKIRTISKSIIDLWIRIDDDKIDIDTLPKIKKYKANIQREYQGYAAAVYECEAEPIRAQEIAIDYISDALSMLRLFSPSNFSTRLVSGMYEYGKGLIETKNLFLFDSVNLGFSQTIEEREELDNFLNIAWRMFVLLTQNINSFKTKDEFITALEDIKYSLNK